MSNSKDIQLVVVGFTGELKMLELQARSLRQYAPNVFSHIHYIANDRNGRVFRRFYRDKIAPELGPLANIATVYDGSVVAGERLSRTDWRSQQTLKLLAARIVSSPSYLILDSKNHFIRPVTHETFLAADGRLKSHRYAVNEKFRSAFQNACHYFGIESVPDDILALPTVTPFLMHTSAVEDMLAVVEKREQRTFHQFFTGNRDFTEFYFYFSYIFSQPSLLDRLYETSLRSQVTLFRSMADNPDRLDEILPVLDEEGVHCFGVHRALTVWAEPSVAAKIAAIWQRFGLVRDAEEARYFLTPDKALQAPYFWQFWR